MAPIAQLAVRLGPLWLDLGLWVPAVLTPVASILWFRAKARSAYVSSLAVDIGASPGLVIVANFLAFETCFLHFL